MTVPVTCLSTALLLAGLLTPWLAHSQEAEPAARPAQAAAADRPAADQPDASPRLADLTFLAGEWTGTDGDSRWNSWYSTPEGGQVLGASKEMRGGRVVMIDFEHFFEHEGALVMTPFPFGKRSVPFTCTELSKEDGRAVFANEEHDFPKRFTYQREAEDRLLITLEGDMGGGPMSITLDLRPTER